MNAVRPDEAPLAMPKQDLRAHRTPGTRRSTSNLLPKLVVGLFAVLIGAWTTWEMYAVLRVAGVIALEWTLLAIFMLNTVWIGFAFVSATFGFLTVLSRRKQRAPGGFVPSTRTAILFPVYNEDAAGVFATVEATAAAMADAAPGAFECFVLSDSNKPDAALMEEEAYLALRGRAPEGCPVFYRRRTLNHARKSGNVEDFVSRWGGRYDHLVVFDADSYMQAETILELVRRMEADPKAGLIQTIPQLLGGETVFARTQQFAGALYGPVLGSGVALWSQDEGNFWGHNAIIRTRAFAEAAGLPVLPGGAPFGGSVMSHDFVEAALLRKAGWKVRIASDLTGSYEECPPSIIDLTIRDRRWCQGNLQHVGVLLRTRGLAWTSRLHLMIGVMSYLASPLWLVLILTGLGLSLQAQFLRPDYFGDGQTLFPNWPVIDSARALRLFLIVMAILFAPKVYGLIAGCLDRRWREAVGVPRIVLGTLAELVISALIAPVLMAAQTSAVISILSGKDAGWSPQQRRAGGYAPGAVMRRHALTMIAGVALLASAFAISPTFAAWLSPAAIGMVLAGPLSLWTGSAAAGRRLRRWGLLLTPEEVRPPSAYVAANQAARAYDGLEPTSLQTLLRDERARERRVGLADRHWPLERFEVHPPLATASMRLARHGDGDDVLSALSTEERMALLNDPEALQASRSASSRRSPADRLSVIGG